MHKIEDSETHFVGDVAAAERMALGVKSWIPKPLPATVTASPPLKGKLKQKHVFIWPGDGSVKGDGLVHTRLDRVAAADPVFPSIAVKRTTPEQLHVPYSEAHQLPPERVLDEPEPETAGAI